MQQMILISDPIACSTCFGHHYAHHQELESIIQVVAACRLWCLVPETCWASSKFSNKNHLLLLIGLLFPHITYSLFI